MLDMRIFPTAPPGLKVVEEVSLHGSLSRDLFWVAFTLIILASLAVAALDSWIGLSQAHHSGEIVNIFLDLLIMAVACMAVFVLHELIHGLVGAFFGAKPRFGAKMLGKVFPVFYTHIPGFTQRNTMWLILLGPTVILNTVLVLLVGVLPNDLWFLLLVTHISGCGGDLVMSLALLRHPKAAWIDDDLDTFRVLGSTSVPVMRPFTETAWYQGLIRWCRWFTIVLALLFVVAAFFPEKTMHEDGSFSIAMQGPGNLGLLAATVIAFAAVFLLRKKKA